MTPNWMTLRISVPDPLVRRSAETKEAADCRAPRPFLCTAEPLR